MAFFITTDFIGFERFIMLGTICIADIYVSVQILLEYYDKKQMP